MIYIRICSLSGGHSGTNTATQLPQVLLSTNQVLLTDIGHPVRVEIVGCLVGDLCVAVNSRLKDREVFGVGLVEMIWEGG